VRRREKAVKYYRMTPAGEVAFSAQLHEQAADARRRAEAAREEALSDPRLAALQPRAASDPDGDAPNDWDQEIVLSVMQLRSNERLTSSLVSATRWLVFVTFLVVVATVALVVVAVRG
jgi:hypothetical protein